MPARILIVDDHPANLVALNALIEPLGHEVVRASSGEEALRSILAHDFAVILLDVKMRGMDGFETAQMMRSLPRARSTPIIFLTAYDSTMLEARRAYDLGAFDFLSKPFDEEVLRYKVVSFVRLYEQTEKLRQQDVFIGVLGHDLRNPLSAISSGLGVMRRRDTVREDDRRVMERMSRAVHRMEGLISDILDFTRGKLGGGIPISRKPDSLDEICRQIVDELQAAHPKRAITIEVAGDVRGQWDAARVGQMLSNLVGNALQHTGSGPVKVTIDGTADERVVLSVTNSGRIPEAVIPRLFEPFRRGEGNSGGLGLGLYIVQLLAQAHGGRARVSADPTRDETSFVLELPRDGATKQVAPPCVLVVDDDEHMRESMADALRAEGYEVVTAKNGREALDQLAQIRPCLVLLDLVMPVMDGWQVMEHLKAEHPSVRYCIVTSVPDHEAAEGIPALQKPLGLDALLKVVRESCGPAQKASASL